MNIREIVITSSKIEHTATNFEFNWSNVNLIYTDVLTK